MRMTFSPVLLLVLLLLCPQFCEAPTIRALDSISTAQERWGAAAARLAQQWQNPDDVLTVLLIIGGDIVQKAIAQLCGPYFVPVAFSFGWVSYSFNALLAVFGDGALMPVIACPSILINARSGYARLNYSWTLNRILRGVEYGLEPLDAALCVSVFRCKPNRYRTTRDMLWWSGVLIIVIQLSIAVVPCIVQGDWTILFATATGISLALAGGCFPQWRKEKWGARPDNKDTVFCLTRGNGFQHVMVIQNQGSGCLNLEDLAMPRRTGCPRECRAAVTLLAVLWILFLINVAGLKQNTWYLLGVGLIGMIQNVSVAAFPRQPQAMGMPLELVTRIQGPKVMSVLMETESKYASVGAALVSTFFPGKLREAEQKFWAARAKTTKATPQPWGSHPPATTDNAAVSTPAMHSSASPLAAPTRRLPGHLSSPIRRITI